jgi:hypothetical protein
LAKPPGGRDGKLILWHGWADPLIYAEGTTDYYTRVQQQMGGPQETSAFIRLFMAPGVGHCSGGTGPVPRNPFDALVAWVEQDHAPEMLGAVRRDETGKIVRSRPLCQYPLVARYKGQGAQTRRRASSARRASEVAESTQSFTTDRDAGFHCGGGAFQVDVVSSCSSFHRVHRGQKPGS